VVLNISEAFKKVKLFEPSIYGQNLASNIRFSCFKPPCLSTTDWQALLGSDVNNLKHMRLMYGFTNALIKSSSDISPEQKNILLVTSLFHDWAEAIVGDIPHPMKTSNDDEREKQILMNIFAEFGICEYSDILDVIFNKNCEMAKIWKSIEVSAYLRTGFNAWRRRFLVNEKALPNLEKMSKNLLLFHMKDLLGNTIVFPHVIFFLRLNADIIDEILFSCSEEQTEKYISAKMMWDEFKCKYLV
jgi:hypothetical protein